MGLREFVAENRSDWERLETLLGDAHRRRLRTMTAAELRELGQLHRKVSADLAASRSFYEDSKVASYLNDLALRSHNMVYRAETRGPLRRLGDLARLIPEAVGRHWNAVGVAFAIFALGILAGAFGTALDESVAVMVLGAPFVERVRRGEYWIERIFDVVPHSVASAGILSNNLSVAIASFATGITGVLTATILFTNGLMLGSVLALCAQYGLLGRFLPFVCAHGVLEVSAIILAGAGGLAMFDGWLDAESGTRREGLRIGARDGLRMALAAAPALLFAGPIEGLISPAESLPAALRITLGLCLGLALWAWLARGVRAGSKPGAGLGAGALYSRPSRLSAR